MSSGTAVTLADIDLATKALGDTQAAYLKASAEAVATKTARDIAAKAVRDMIDRLVDQAEAVAEVSTTTTTTAPTVTVAVTEQTGAAPTIVGG